jgi:hypothetical protein
MRWRRDPKPFPVTVLIKNQSGEILIRELFMPGGTMTVLVADDVQLLSATYNDVEVDGE